MIEECTPQRNHGGSFFGGRYSRFFHAHSSTLSAFNPCSFTAHAGGANPIPPVQKTSVVEMYDYGFHALRSTLRASECERILGAC
jgi:hypothetical protein